MLDYIRSDNGMLRIGAMTRHRALEFSPVVAEQLPLLTEAIRLVAHLPIRSRGTIGGSLALADPAAELPMLLQVLEGEVVRAGPKGDAHHQGSRSVRRHDDHELSPPMRSSARCGFRRLRRSAGFAVEEFARRRGDFAIAAITAVIERAGTHCRKARLGDRRRRPDVDPADRR